MTRLSLLRPNLPNIDCRPLESMSSLVRISESKRPAQIEKQLGAVVDALDRLFVHEVPADDRRRITLRLVWPVAEAIDRDPVGAGLRAFITRRGWDLWAIGGDLELFAAARAVMTSRPERRMWNRTQLAALWGDIGEHGQGRR
jgi:hypothetical protein